MHKLFKAAIFIFLVNNLVAQPLRFYDKADSAKFTALDVAADDKGGWLTLGSALDSSFSIIQFDYCGKVITNQKYLLPVEHSKLNTPQIIYLGKDSALVYGTLTTETDSRIIIFYSFGGIISQVRLLSTPNFSQNYNPLISLYDHDNILIAYNYDTNNLAKSSISMLSRNFNRRWTRNIDAESHIRWIKMLDINHYAIGDGNTLKKYDTLGTNIWSRSFPLRTMVFNSVESQDSQLVFLTDYMDTLKTNYKQVISLDHRNGKLIWRSPLTRSIRSNYLLEYNSRLLLDNKKNFVFNAIDTMPGDPIPALYAHTLDANGNLLSSIRWSTKDSVIDYKSSLLDDGNYGIGIILGNADTLKGYANVKGSMSYEGACQITHDSNFIFRSLLMDTLTLRSLPISTMTPQNSFIQGKPDNIKLKRVCEEFDLKSGDVPTPLCKGDSVFLAGIKLPNGTYQWENGSHQEGIWVNKEGDYKVTITYCEKTAVNTYKVTYITYSDQNIAMEECDYPLKLDAFSGRPDARYFWSNGDTSRFLNIAGPGTYTVNVTQCEMTFRITFHVTLKTFHDQSFDFSNICDYPAPIYAFQGNSIKGATYIWDDGSTNGTRLIPGPGTYKVTVSYCQSTFVQTYNIKGREFSDSLFTFRICDYPAPIYAFQGPTILGASYNWDNGSTNGTRLIPGPGTYKVTVSYCKTSFVETFDIKLREFADSLFTFNICDYPAPIYAFQGPTILGATYKWDDGSTNGTRLIPGPGIYKVTVDYCQSKFVETYNIKLRQFADSSFTFKFCNYPDTLYAFEGLNVKYKWDDGTTDGKRRITAPGTYKVSINYCQAAFVETFNISEKFADSTETIILSCDQFLKGYPLELHRTNTTYKWDNNSTDSVRFITKQDTPYTVTITKCSESYVLSFIAKSDQVFKNSKKIRQDLCLNFPIKITDTININAKILWSNNSTTDTTRVQPGVYRATIDYCGTQYIDTFDVSYLDQDLAKFPNVFPPNSEVEVNKIFKPVVTDVEKIAAFNIEIYNRWGQRVFESNNINDGWNGTFKGEPAPMDTYLFVASISAKCGLVKGVKGSVTLVR